MTEIHLINRHAITCTVVSNQFIEYYMPQANGEFVKVYLCLLRCLQESNPRCSVAQIADLLNHTEADIVRAIRYWEKQGLLSLELAPDQTISGICFLDPQPLSHSEQVSSRPNYDIPSETAAASLPVSNIRQPAATVSLSPSAPLSNSAKPSSSVPVQTSVSVPSAGPVSPPENPQEPRQYTADEITEFSRNPDIEELFFVIATYIKHPLTASDTNFILFWYDSLKFSAELITYLVEYCISKSHSSLRYMNKVALGWKSEGVETVEDAKENAAIHSQAYYAVMKALGICGRNLVPSETDLIAKWTGEYGFSTEMIQEACSRTISATHQPSFEYTDSILSNWRTKGVQNLDDVKAADEQFAQKKKAENSKTNASAKSGSSADHPATRFSNFAQRNYDEEELERMLLNRPHNS